MNRKVLFAAAAIAAIGLLGGCATSGSKSVQKYEKQALQHFSAGDAEKGFAVLEEGLKKHPDSLPLGNFYRVEIRKRAAEERSISFFKALVGEDKANPAPNEAYYNLAFAYIDKIPRVGPMGAGFLSKRSISMFREVLDREPDNWIANYGIGMNYLHWPDYFKKNDSALDYFLKCIDLQEGQPTKPFYLLTYLRLGDGYARNNDVDKAIEIWKEGLKLFPAHPDLVARLDIERDRVITAVNEYYNPNKSIGAIDTDVSVLWAKTVPKAAVPLRRQQTARGGVGGQLSTGKAELSEGDLGLFSWFLRNLPFLSDKRFYSQVDMSTLGVESKGDRLANEIAHGMIEGFLSVMEDHSPEKIREKTQKMDGFARPFYHEGIGMGLAAALDATDPESFKGFMAEIQAVDPHYTRLHLAGAGMWFGLESSRSLDTVVKAFDWLGPFGAAYAYEGFGFAQMLFHLNRDPETLKIGMRLPPLAAQSFYHGAGRAFWILGAGDPAALGSRIELVPASYRNDAYSGYGMGVSFTRVTDPAVLAGYWKDGASGQINLDELATGAIMGYTIRSIADEGYMKEVLEKARQNGACWMPEALEMGRGALSNVESTGGDFHSNWRSKIRERVLAAPRFVETRRCS